MRNIDRNGDIPGQPCEKKEILHWCLTGVEQIVHVELWMGFPDENEGKTRSPESISIKNSILHRYKTL